MPCFGFRFIFLFYVCLRAVIIFPLFTVFASNLGGTMVFDDDATAIGCFFDQIHAFEK